MQKHRHGGDIYEAPYRIDFSANINPLGTPERVILAAKRGAELSANYPDVQCRELITALAQKEGVGRGELLCGNGAAELIFAAVAAQRPGKALLLAPGFAEYEQALRSADCEIVRYYLREENGFGIGEDYLDFLTEDLDMIFFCNPNNPTGVLTGRKKLMDILDICSSRQIRVVLDSCFVDFLEDEETADFVSVLEQYPCLLILKAFTKIYAMAGLRLGYCMCSDFIFLEKMRQVMQPWSVSIPAQMAGTAALREAEFVSRTKALIIRERKWMKKELTLLGYKVYGSKANFIFFHGVGGLAEACRKEGILIRDCSNYCGLEEGYYRVAVRTHGENEELIRVLAAVSGQAGG